MPVWNMRIFPVASIPFPKGIAIQSIKETTIDNCKKISEYKLSICNRLLLNILQVISQKYGLNL